jgi:hypothetical protein
LIQIVSVFSDPSKHPSLYLINLEIYKIFPSPSFLPLLLFPGRVPLLLMILYIPHTCRALHFHRFWAAFVKSRGLIGFQRAIMRFAAAPPKQLLLQRSKQLHAHLDHSSPQFSQTFITFGALQLFTILFTLLYPATATADECTFAFAQPNPVATPTIFLCDPSASYCNMLVKLTVPPCSRFRPLRFRCVSILRDHDVCSGHGRWLHLQRTDSGERGQPIQPACSFRADDAMFKIL